mgnify:CR=1 FL=1
MPALVAAIKANPVELRAEAIAATRKAFADALTEARAAIIRLAADADKLIEAL